MSLSKYREKRHFDKTPEPAPGASAPAAGTLQYCVQRHHATRLHYDLRLEVAGALKSWAVPKGPTLDPNEKRLAMMVEDHPMEYGGFEGIIPKGNYGAGSVMLWDRGTYELLGDATADEQLKRGDFKFRLAGEKLKGDFAIVRTKRGKGNEWLLIKKKDDAASPGWNAEEHNLSVLSGLSQEEIAQGLAPRTDRKRPRYNLSKLAGAVKTPMPKAVAPMLAQIGKLPLPKEAGWVYEVKWDGVRAVAYIAEGRVRMVSRKGTSMDQQYPELSVLPHHLRASSAIVDGEIAALDAKGVPSFERLQRRITVADPASIAALARSTPVVLYLFDLLYLDGYDLRGVSLEERKRLLHNVLEANNTVRYSDHFEDGKALLMAVQQQGLEGIVGKRATSRYESRRSADWLKYKVQSSETFVICGFTEGERDYFGALILGMYEGNKLHWVGNVGTGFDLKTMRAIHEKLLRLVTSVCPLVKEKDLPKKDVTWVRPELCAEIRFGNWTQSGVVGRLRAPVWVGFRDDIEALECRRSDAPAQPRAPLIDASLKEEILSIDGHQLKFTNLDKVFYPGDGYVKRDLINYYDAVAPLLLPHLKDRPLSLKRYPDGIHHGFFFQKQVAESFPSWLRTEMADGTRFAIGDDRATLLFLVNLGCIDHNPWMSRVGSLEHPDYVLIDLDPYQCGYERIVDAALWVRSQLERIHVESYPKTTGGDGMHIFIPLEPLYTYAQVRAFAEALAALAAAARPDLFTTPRAVARREKGKVYFDWQQIAEGKTISAPYVLRPYAGAPVATPLEWSEVTPHLRPEQFHMSNVLARFDRVGDLFAPVLNKPQKLEKAVENLVNLR